MKVKSIYEHIEQAFDAVGEENAKFFFRHSLRGHIDHPKNSEKILLTNEGKALARWFGKNMQAQIGFAASSHNERCLQTLNCIFAGQGTEHKIEIARMPLAEPQVKEKRLSDKTFKRYKFDAGKMFFDVKHGKPLPGMYSLERSVKNMLDYIFSTGGAKNTLDLYCSHDFMLVLLACAMFDYPEERDRLVGEQWPCMLEGMVFTGTRKKFKALWRGETKIFENYLMEEIDRQPQFAIFRGCLK